MTYRVQYKNSLGDADWTDLPTAPVITGSKATIADALVANRQRFYRIREVD